MMPINPPSRPPPDPRALRLAVIALAVALTILVAQVLCDTLGAWWMAGIIGYPVFVAIVCLFFKGARGPRPDDDEDGAP